MRLSYEWLILIVLVLLSICLTDSASNNKSLKPKRAYQRNVRQTLKSEQNVQKEQKDQKYQKDQKNQTAQQLRPRRQKPSKRKKQVGIFSSLGSLVKDTFRDVRVGYKNISRLVENSFSPSPTPPPDDSMSSATGDNNVTTPMPLGRQQVFDLLGKNYRGLRKLWDVEYKNAMSESRKNIRRFQKELRESIRPFLQPNENNVT